MSSLEPPGTSQAEVPICWVCLEEGTNRVQLYKPCSCPRYVHAQCLARWQLHSAGTKEELFCRFCEVPLPDWREVLQPNVDPSLPVHHVQVKTGEGAYEEFLNEIRAIFGITDDHDMHLAFDCADPVTGALVKLNGAGSFQAAVHCATISAAKRLRTVMGKRRRDGRRLDSLHMADSASSLDMDNISPQPASPCPPQQLLITTPQEGRGSGCGGGNIASRAAIKEDHRQVLQLMIRRVMQLRSMQASGATVATPPDRLEILEAQLRQLLESSVTEPAAAQAC